MNSLPEDPDELAAALRDAIHPLNLWVGPFTEYQPPVPGRDSPGTG